jgi:hypothetical protein
LISRWAGSAAASQAFGRSPVWPHNLSAAKPSSTGGRSTADSTLVNTSRGESEIHNFERESHRLSSVTLIRPAIAAGNTMIAFLFLFFIFKDLIIFFNPEIVDSFRRRAYLCVMIRRQRKCFNHYMVTNLPERTSNKYIGQLCEIYKRSDF